MADRVAPGPQAILFDVGRVIVRLDVGRALGALGADAGRSAEQVWSAIQADPLWHDWQEGRVAPHRWHEHLARRFGLQLSWEQFCQAWNSTLDPETLLDDDFFAGLAERYRLGLLSNTDPIHMAHPEAHFRFVRHFPVRVYSCVVGASKPDAAIYRRAIREAGVAPQQILYIDDVQAYVAAAEQAGLQALLFRSPEQLIRELRERRILQA